MTTETIQLTEEHARFIREVVASGRYQDISEVVRASVDLLEARVAEQRSKEEQLRTMLEKAKASGISDRTAREAWDDAKARYRQKNA